VSIFLKLLFIDEVLDSTLVVFFRLFDELFDGGLIVFLICRQ
jgi:hypothetical protein